MKIQVYEIPHNRGGGYDLSQAEIACELKADSGDYFDKRDIALVYVGTYLDHNGGLAAIKDDVQGTTFFHFNGFSGEIVKCRDARALRKHLQGLGINAFGSFN